MFIASAFQVSVGDKLAVHIDGADRIYTGTLRQVALDPAFTPHYALNEKERARLVYLAEVQLPPSAAELPWLRQQYPELMVQRILAIFLKELRQLARDKPTLGMVVMVPLIQLLLFGYAINTDVRHLPVAVVESAAPATCGWMWQHWLSLPSLGLPLPPCGSRKQSVENPMDLLGSVVYLYKLADACDSGG